ncbi:hypothetical protein [Hymenobacter metallicola]|uniref:Lipocalin-like domain-containing protein n=1 Tax=Hymenobacter metallicola TaxID=2563114 RepID=A0A4Z0Q2D1_9BACT|nr:hypothetical protein [Hymenobacter metallicola]TGE22882.1 hypothetical protein E5K02_21200 [Hymenobacter metallicola]
MRLLLFSLSALLLLGSCSKESDPTAPIVTQASFDSQIQGRNWVESWEEEQPGSDIKVFRPDTYAFPASWPRNGFRFDENGVFTGRGPSPTDGIAIYPGLWITEDNSTFRITPSGKSISYGLQLISIQNDVLYVRRVE